MAGDWPRLNLPQPSSRPTRFTLSVVVAVVAALAPLWYVAATVAKAPREIVQASPSMAAETRLDLALRAPASSPITAALMPVSIETEIVESSSIDSPWVGDVRPEMLSVLKPSSPDSELFFPEPRPLDVRAFALAAKKI